MGEAALTTRLFGNSRLLLAYCFAISVFPDQHSPRLFKIVHSHYSQKKQGNTGHTLFPHWNDSKVVHLYPYPTGLKLAIRIRTQIIFGAYVCVCFISIKSGEDRCAFCNTCGTFCWFLDGCTPGLFSNPFSYQHSSCSLQTQNTILVSLTISSSHNSSRKLRHMYLTTYLIFPRIHVDGLATGKCNMVIAVLTVSACHPSHYHRSGSSHHLLPPLKNLLTALPAFTSAHQ